MVTRGRSSILSGLTVLTLALVGGLLAPPAYKAPAVSSKEAVGHLAAAPASESAPIPSDAKITRQDVRVPVKGADLDGTVVAPATSGSHPAIVWVHGSGSTDKTEFAREADRLARAGIASLLFEKRTDGYNFRYRDFGLLADDALAGVELMRKRAGIDPDKVGIWGVSEGTWVVPIAAAQSQAVNFVILVSPPIVTPIRQITWAFNDQLKRLRAPEGARQLLARATATAATDGFTFLRHDVEPLLRQVRQPVLAMYGTGDPSVPFAQSYRSLRAALEDGGNHQLTARFFGNADHALKVDGRNEFTPGYLETLNNWITSLPESASGGDAAAGGPGKANPEQRYMASDLPDAPWYGSVGALLAAMIAVAIGFLAGPAAALARKLFRGGHAAGDGTAWRAVRRRLYWLAASGIAQVVTLAGFVGIMVYFALNQTGNAVVAQVGWLVVRLGALLTLVLASRAIVSAWAYAHEGWRPGVAQRAALFGVTGSTALLLVMAAYFGLFTLGW